MTDFQDSINFAGNHQILEDDALQLLQNESGLNDDEEGEEEEEEITPSELIEKLKQSWLNEKFAPDLLEHKTAVVECIIDQIKHMERNIKSARTGDFRISLHKLEIDRIKYMLHSYLRLRIKKVC
jgi:GINS complex subunit 4